MQITHLTTSSCNPIVVAFSPLTAACYLQTSLPTRTQLAIDLRLILTQLAIDLRLLLTLFATLFAFTTKRVAFI